jgi:hypothetical protein
LRNIPWLNEDRMSQEDLSKINAVLKADYERWYILDTLMHMNSLEN